MIETNYVPNASSWIHMKGSEKRIVVSERDTNILNVYNIESKDPIKVLKIHNKPVHLIQYNSVFDTVVSVDQIGVIEYWSPSTFSLPQKNLKFKYKAETDLYHFAKVIF